MKKTSNWPNIIPFFNLDAKSWLNFQLIWMNPKRAKINRWVFCQFQRSVAAIFGEKDSSRNETRSLGQIRIFRPKHPRRYNFSPEQVIGEIPLMIRTGKCKSREISVVSSETKRDLEPWLKIQKKKGKTTYIYGTKNHITKNKQI